MMENDNQFLVMWDNLGLECIIPIDMAILGDAGDMLNVLEGNSGNKYKNDIYRKLSILELRARTNSHRYYEIYSLRTCPSITKETLEKLFEENPQAIVDLIREKGTVIFNGRRTTKPVIS